MTVWDDKSAIANELDNKSVERQGLLFIIANKHQTSKSQLYSYSKQSKMFSLQTSASQLLFVFVCSSGKL